MPDLLNNVISKVLSQLKGSQQEHDDTTQKQNKIEEDQIKPVKIESNPKVEELIRILRDNSQNEYKRDDAMMELANFKETRAIETLIASLSRDPAVSHYQPLRASMALSKMNDKRIIPYLLNIIQNAEVQRGADALTPAVSSAIKVLGNIGEKSDAEILISLREKIMNRGIKSELVNTGSASGRMSTMDQIRVINSAIENLKKK